MSETTKDMRNKELHNHYLDLSSNYVDALYAKNIDEANTIYHALAEAKEEIIYRMLYLNTGYEFTGVKIYGK